MQNIKTLTKYQFGIFVLVSMMLIISVNYLLSSISDQGKLAAAINASGYQRMLSQKIALQVGQLQAAREISTYAHSVQEVLSTTRLMEELHQRLTLAGTGTQPNFHVSDVLRAIYFGPTDNLDAEIDNYFIQVRTIAGLDFSEVAKRDALTRELGESAKGLLSKLERVVIVYQNESDQQVQDLKNFYSALLFVTLLVLIASTSYILRLSLRGIDEGVQERDAVSRRLHISEQSLANAQRIAKIGNWEMDILNNSLTWSDEVYRLIGIKPGLQPPSHETYLSAVHPQDIRKVLLASQEALSMTSPYEVQYRLVSADGHTKYVRERGETLFDENGKPHHVTGTVQDVSELVRAQNQVMESKRYLSDAIEAIDEAFALYDKEDALVMANHRYYEFYPNIAHLIRPGVKFETLVRESVAKKQTHPTDIDSELWIDKRISHHKANSDEHFELLLSGGRWLRISESATQDGGVVQIEADITQSKLQHNALQEARKAADKANKAKSQFLSNMSHELRTPLNAILGFAQMLDFIPQAPLNEKQKEYVGYIVKSGSHLLTLIDDILDLAKIEAGRIALSFENIPLDKIADECMAMIEPVAMQNNIRITNEISDATLPFIRGDYTRLKQILMNLLSNAIKYNRTNGTVILTARPHGEEQILISVIDTGPGIPPERMNELFMPFNRLDAENSEIEGTGIGLTITKNLVELMSGKISCESLVGSGTTFSVELPVALHSDHPEPCAVEAQLQDSEPLFFEHAGTHIVKVLYVEDNPDSLRLMEAIVAGIPRLDLVSAHNGEIGIEVARTHHPDIIILDINLPGINGIEVLERLQGSTETQHIPVIALSANAMDTDVQKGHAAGFFAYLTKPIEIRLLIKTIEKALKNQVTN